jgi:alpha-mannosidase
LALDEMRPAELDHVVSQDKAGNPMRPLPAEGEGFLEMTGQDVALVTWKQAEDGNGTILRLREIAGKPGETVVRFPHSNIASAQLCSGVEDDLHSLPVQNNSVRVSFQPFEVVTLRIVQGQRD